MKMYDCKRREMRDCVFIRTICQDCGKVYYSVFWEDEKEKHVPPGEVKIVGCSCHKTKEEG